MQLSLRGTGDVGIAGNEYSVQGGVMMRLDNTLSAWGDRGFEHILKQELVLNAAHLPLQQGLSTGNYVADAPITATIINVIDKQGVIQVRVGIFFQSLIGGCSCADDPTPVSEINEYCELLLEIDKKTALTGVVLRE